MVLFAWKRVFLWRRPRTWISRNQGSSLAVPVTAVWWWAATCIRSGYLQLVVPLVHTHVVALQERETQVVQGAEGAPVVVHAGGATLAQGMQPGALVVAPVMQTAVVAVGIAGTPGIQGPIGPAGGTAMERRAGETLSALKVVWEDEFGRVWPLSAMDDAHVFLLLGLTLTAADAGGLVNVQRSGVVDDAAWSWTPGQRVYLGQGGALTASPAEEGFHILIGTAASATRLLLNIQDPLGVITH